MPDVVYNFNGWAGSTQGESFPIKDGLIALGVQVGKASAEFKFFSFNSERPESAPSGSFYDIRQSVRVDTEKPAHPRPLEFQKARRPVMRMQVDGILPDRPENPLQHVVKMYANIGGDTARLRLPAFPAGVVPVAPGGDVCQVYIKLGVTGGLLYALPELLYAGVQAKLQDIEYRPAGFSCYFLQGIQVPGIEYHRLFTNDICSMPQPKPDVGIMKIVGRANTEIVKWCAGALQLFEVPVEAFVLHKKGGIRKKGVDDPHGIMFVKCCNEVVAGILYGLHVPGSNVTGRSDQRKVVFHGCAVGLGKGMDLVSVFQVDGPCCRADGA